MAAAKRLFDEALWQDPEFGLPTDAEPVVLPPADATDAGVARQWSIVSMASRSTPMGPVIDTAWTRGNHQWINWLVNFYGATTAPEVWARVSGAWVQVGVLADVSVRSGGTWMAAAEVNARVSSAWVPV